MPFPNEGKIKMIKMLVSSRPKVSLVTLHLNTNFFDYTEQQYGILEKIHIVISLNHIFC